MISLDFVNFFFYLRCKSLILLDLDIVHALGRWLVNNGDEERASWPCQE
jgi:hypothetical protein